MDNHERIRTILKHCIKNECYGCPLRQSRECVRSMAFSANQEIVHLEKRVKELEKRNNELENEIACRELEENPIECFPVEDFEEESEDE